MEPEELGVVLDPSGRAHDVVHFGDSTIETRFLTALHVAGGRLRVLDGNAIQVNPAFFEDEATAVDFAPDEDLVVSDPDFEATHDLFDFDGSPGIDTLVFANGVGDGAFPMSRGFDAARELASLLVRHPRDPWRLAVPDGTPPTDVSEREVQLRQRLAGTRPLDEFGNCSDTS